MTQKEKEAEWARAYLLKIITSSTKLGIVINKVSRSGMQRRMRVIVAQGFDIRDITHDIGQLCTMNVNDDGLRVGGCGMDMAFWLADHITYKLWQGAQGDMAKAGLFKGNGGSCLDWKVI